MKKKEILNNILSYIAGNSFDKSGNDNEIQFTNEIIDQFQTDNNIQPPGELYYKIIEKKNSGIEKKSLFDLVLRTGNLGITGALAGLLIVVSAFFWFYSEENKDTMIAGNTFKESARGESIKHPGLEIQSETKGEISIVSSEKSNNIFLKSGGWEVLSDHRKFKNETWFHFPGGGLKPIGTNFIIKIINDKTFINLTEGKIQTYSTDENGNLRESRISQAPYRKDFSGPLILDLEEVETITSTSNQEMEKIIQEQKIEDTLIVRKNKRKIDSVYDYFIGAEIIVKDKKGNKVSGILLNIEDGKLIIKNPNEIIRVDEESMTLIGLDVHDANLRFGN